MRHVSGLIRPGVEGSINTFWVQKAAGLVCPFTITTLFSALIGTAAVTTTGPHKSIHTPKPSISRHLTATSLIVLYWDLM